jgi:hypothetical protein
LFSQEIFEEIKIKKKQIETQCSVERAKKIEKVWIPRDDFAQKLYNA